MALARGLRDGCNGLNRPIEHRGRDAILIDGLDGSRPTVQRSALAI